jgi:hypothetical protein
MSNNRFVTPDFQQEIFTYVINHNFPNMNTINKNIILKYLSRLLDIVAYSIFKYDLQEADFNLREKYYNQLRENNYRDVYGFMNMLLPFINDKSDTTKITSINDIYNKKKTNVDISKNAPNYIYSNIQYGLINETNYQEVEWDENHIRTYYFAAINTIRLTSNTLHINWINIFPEENDTHNIISYKIFDSYNWANDMEFMDFTKLADPDNITNLSETNLNKNLIKLQTETIYDVLSNMYHNLKNIKWLIYDFMIQLEGDTTPVPLLFILNITMNYSLNFCINKRWEDLEENNKILFTNDWESFLNSKNFTKQTFSINNFNLSNVKKSILVFFYNYYSNKDEALKSVNITNLSNIIKSSKEESEGIEEEDISSFNIINIIKILKSIDVQHIYTYFRDCLLIFKNFFFSPNFIVYNENLKQFEFLTLEQHNNYKNSKLLLKKNTYHIITFKNYYNFLKSLFHITSNNNYFIFPRYSVSLTKEIKDIFISRIKNTLLEMNKVVENRKIYTWFNISSNLKRLFPQLNNKELKEQNNFIETDICAHLIYYVFQQLKYQGLLSKFILNNHITNENNFSNMDIDKIKEKKIDLLKNNNNYKGNFNYNHYLEHIMYSKLMINNKTYVDFNYSKDGDLWFEGYAFNWVSQFNFFNKYLNHRVIFVTGATGQGKTTLIPILFLYALLAINFNYTGKIANTQPRIAPTKTTSTYIAKNLGVPIVNELDNSIIKNFYIQYSYKKDKHISSNKNLSLKVMTDGSLWNTISQNIILKTKFDNNYSPYNIYDILMIDEAHEHNKNMDLILTLARTCAYYNNSIKIVIISATMDDDEPIYRRYYKLLNDNLMYPFNHSNISNSFIINRTLLERRIDISPPGQTTRFAITEHEKIPDKTPNSNDKIVADLTFKSKSGNLLYFQPGKKEIITSMNYLIKNASPNTLILPYYSELDDKKKLLISDQLTNLIKNIKIGINTPFDSDAVSDPLNPPSNKKENNNFTRAIIIATNIAEASLTIPDLKYVIDTGIQKTMKYNYKYGVSVLVPEYISESSRLQRRGRVGRKSSGDIIYLYPKNTTENIKISYAICRENIVDLIYSLIYKNSKDRLIFGASKDPYNISINKEEYSYIAQQYFIFNGSSFEHINSFIKDNSSHISIYDSGFDINTLLDNNGSFYIIHPDENYIIRNIAGKITGIKTSQNPLENYIKYSNYSIDSEKMYSFIASITNNLYLITYNDSLNQMQYIKTKFGIMMNTLMEKLDLHDKYVRTYIISRVLEVDDKLLLFISFMASNRSTSFYSSFVSGQLENKKYKIKINDFTNLYPKKDSDIKTIISVLENFIKFLQLKNINIDLRSNLFIDIFRNILLTKKIPENNYTNIFNKWLKNKKIDLSKIDYKENRFMKDYIKYIRDSTLIIDCIIQDIELNYKEIEKWCKYNYIKPEIIHSFIKKYLEITNYIYIVENSELDTNYDIENKLDIQELLKYAKELLINNTYNIRQDDKIDISIMYGFYSNIYINYSGTPYYLSMQFPDIYFTPHINTITKNILDTHVSPSTLNNYIIGLNIDSEDIGLTYINNIKPYLLKYISLIYGKAYLDTINNLQNTDIILTNTDKIKYGIISNYKRVLQEIKNTINTYYDKNFINNQIRNNLKQNNITDISNYQIGGVYSLDNLIISPELEDYVKKLKNE